MNKNEEIDLEKNQIITPKREINELKEKCCKIKKKYIILILICLILITLIVILYLIFRKKGCGKNCNIPCYNCCYDEFGNYIESDCYPNCNFICYNQTIGYKKMIFILTLRYY